jgi:hypothetical protein
VRLFILFSGPESKEETFQTLADDAENPIHHGKMGKKRNNYRNEMEAWEKAEVFTT